MNALSYRLSYRLRCIRIACLHTNFKYFNVKAPLYSNSKCENENAVDPLEKLVENLRDGIFYNSVLDKKKVTQSYTYSVIKFKDQIKKKEELKAQQARDGIMPLALQYIYEDNNVQNHVEAVSPTPPKSPCTNFPYKDAYENVVAVKAPMQPHDNDAGLEVRTRFELYNANPELMNNWMQDYDNYEVSETQRPNLDYNVNYGTADPKTEISNVPCGGCGALLHCKDTAIPGYLPSEIYKNSTKFGGTDLTALVCQRCHFLKEYNIALQVRVKPEDYPKILATIAQKKHALVVLMIDLLDYPCSIWPGILDLIGRNRPIVIVGNKIDLIPRDKKGYLERIKQHLLETMRLEGFGMSNILEVALISAKTGYGVEELVTMLQSKWGNRGDVYLVGCTNVGKSSLFNALIQSDFCRSKAEDLVQRATTSPWPGTTLNLLKFPILRPTSWKLYVRHKRLMTTKRLAAEEEKLRRQHYKQTGDTQYATLIGRIERTFTNTDVAEDFSMKGGKSSMAVSTAMGPDCKEFALSKWCYDTPGVVQPDQIIHMLTTEELLELFSKELIQPQTFTLQPGRSLFIAGLARLDYLHGDRSVRFTAFTSKKLPITICQTEKADSVYKTLLGTELFSVPKGYPGRLTVWPGLEPSKEFSLKGVDRNISAKDLVLSSTGWIAITPDNNKEIIVRGWTPEGRGIVLRDCLLPFAVSLRGKRIRKTSLYMSNKIS